MNLFLIGANDGISFDSISERIKDIKVSGIAIEPVYEYYILLLENFKKWDKINCLNVAVHEKQQNLEIFKVKSNRLKLYPDWARGINSLFFNHLRKLKIESKDIESVNVPAVNMEYLISRYFDKQKRVYLQMDVEGYDSEILKALDLEDFRPLMIKYEHVNIEMSNKKIVENKLRNNDYHILRDINDSIALDLRRIRLI